MAKKLYQFWCKLIELGMACNGYTQLHIANGVIINEIVRGDNGKDD